MTSCICSSSPKGATASRRSPDGGADDNVIIWLKNLGCNGTERDLGACIAKGENWGDTEHCSHDKDARVLCGGKGMVIKVTQHTA